ncbi:hypothetical protein BCR35DRAFT_335221 [Leucosporidium creatinivorum]|uniref:ATP synthase subunit 5, mitochondrial n=1 Tax=Leucosporidium creatinivorum TaxID=106004 RepID=A0A1Y2DFE6_9BASI|nr:hypothetical protein BCR35DRAFT_335221 [Leucosporidium creatinivorum]
MSFVRQAVRATRQVRTYATPAASATLPPIQLNGLSGKYAGALFTAAAKKDAAALKKVESDLLAVKAAIKAEPSIQDFLANPVLSSSDKSSGIDALLSKASPKSAASDLTKNFFEGEVKVTITTAQPLEKDLQKRLEEALKGSALAGSGKTLIIENKVNDAVLGGLVVDFGDKTVDLSVASKVNKLNAQISGKSPPSLFSIPNASPY